MIDQVDAMRMLPCCYVHCMTSSAHLSSLVLLYLPYTSLHRHLQIFLLILTLRSANEHSSNQKESKTMIEECEEHSEKKVRRKMDDINNPRLDTARSSGLELLCSLFLPFVFYHSGYL